MRMPVILSGFAALLLVSANARAEDCRQLQAQSAQIDCLQRALEALRSDVDELRSVSPTTTTAKALAESQIDEKIRRAVTSLERKLEEQAQPRVHLLNP